MLWRSVRRNRKATAGVVLLFIFLVLAIFPGELSPYSPTAIAFEPGLGPSSAHWLGTTSQGQDILSQLIWGTRQTLIIAFAAGGLATVIAVIVGVSAAYLGGFADGALSLVTDVLLVIPIFPLIIVIAAYLRGTGLAEMIIVLGALGWSYGARQLRVQTLSLRNRDFLMAARVRGEKSAYIIVAEIMPTTDIAHRSVVPGYSRFRRTDRGRATVRRAREPQLAELGQHALLGAEQRGSRRRFAVVGDHAWCVYRSSRGSFRLLELRLRRDLKPRAPAGAPDFPPSFVAYDGAAIRAGDEGRSHAGAAPKGPAAVPDGWEGSRTSKAPASTVGPSTTGRSTAAQPRDRCWRSAICPSHMRPMPGLW